MIHITAQMRVLVAIESVDLRKGIDGLAQLCREKLGADPFSYGCRLNFALSYPLFNGFSRIYAVEPRRSHRH